MHTRLGVRLSRSLIPAQLLACCVALDNLLNLSGHLGFNHDLRVMRVYLRVVFEDELDITSKLVLNIGIRTSSFLPSMERA